VGKFRSRNFVAVSAPRRASGGGPKTKQNKTKQNKAKQNNEKESISHRTVTSGKPASASWNGKIRTEGGVGLKFEICELRGALKLSVHRFV
jgi:hypothetical protein